MDINSLRIDKQITAADMPNIIFCLCKVVQDKGGRVVLPREAIKNLPKGAGIEIEYLQQGDCFRITAHGTKPINLRIVTGN